MKIDLLTKTIAQATFQCGYRSGGVKCRKRADYHYSWRDSENGYNGRYHIYRCALHPMKPESIEAEA